MWPKITCSMMHFSDEGMLVESSPLTKTVQLAYIFQDQHHYSYSEGNVGWHQTASELLRFSI